MASGEAWIKVMQRWIVCALVWCNDSMVLSRSNIWTEPQRETFNTSNMS